jgi:hypothetical protein
MRTGTLTVATLKHSTMPESLKITLRRFAIVLAIHEGVLSQWMYIGPQGLSSWSSRASPVELKAWSTLFGCVLKALLLPLYPFIYKLAFTKPLLFLSLFPVNSIIAASLIVIVWNSIRPPHRNGGSNATPSAEDQGWPPAPTVPGKMP